MTDLNLLDHSPVRRAFSDPASHDFLKDILSSAASHDPVDVLNDLQIAHDLVGSYLGVLVAPDDGPVRSPHEAVLSTEI
jgi:hypothetical protein